MASLGIRFLGAAAWASLLAGCVSLVVEGNKDGIPLGVNEARRLEIGKTTLTQTITRAGPPDLLLRVGDIDRVYYVSWDSIFFKVVFSVSLPAGKSLSADAFILGVGAEELQLARLEFDRKGLLRDLQIGEFGLSSAGQSVGIDNRVVESFLEDRARALSVTDEPDDDDWPPR